ncbi:MAG: hypothetical protein ACRCUT_06855, partial [Spirochaetota bacterium]
MKIFIGKSTVPLPSGREKEFAFCTDVTRQSVHPPIPPLVEAGTLFGYVDSDPDVDGSIRAIRL